MRASRRVAASIVACSAVLPGCDFTSFETFRSHAPVVTVQAPNNFPSNRYGGLVAVAADAQLNDWLVVSDGIGTPVVVQPLRFNDVIAPGTPDAQFVCSSASDCGGSMRFGAAIAAIDAWQDGTACAMSGSFGAVHSVEMRCVGNTPARHFMLTPTPGLEMAGFGLAIAAPRRHRFADLPARDVLFVGAPAVTGAVLAVTPSGSVNITPHGVSANGLGSALAVGRFRASDGTIELLLAVGSTSGTVVVMHGDPRAPGGARPMQPLGCFMGSEPGFGLALTTADLDGDGSDEIVVGNGAEVNNRVDAVHVYSPAQATSPTNCNATWPELLTVHCSDVADRGVTCANLASGFGSALSAGDLDGDGRDEVLVGAHFATVDGVAHAGAVYVLSSSGTGAALTVTTGAVLRDQAPVAEAELGRDVRAALIGHREEPIVAAPGAFAVRLFFCSGIPGDRPNTPGLSAECR